MFQSPRTSATSAVQAFQGSSQRHEVSLQAAHPWLALLVAIAACGDSQSRSPQPTAADSLVGTWQVLRFEPSPRAGRPALYSHTDKPVGYLVYDATGHVFLQIVNRDAQDSLRHRSLQEAPDSLLQQMLRSFRAYFGTYRTDSVAGVVVHQLEGELLPRRGSWETATPFRVAGDTLILGADSLERWFFKRVSTRRD